MLRMNPPRTCSAPHTNNATTTPHTPHAYTCVKRIKRNMSNIKDLRAFKRNIKRNIWPLKRNIGGVLA